MDTTIWLPATLIAALAFGVWLYRKMPDLARSATGFTILIAALGVMPLLLLAMGTTAGLQRSKTRTFCTSCHEMEIYEKSLLVDDSSFVPASHFQKRRVPADTACYSCHTDYTLYGDVQAKLKGLKHVWVHYMGDVPERGKIELYDPYPNDNCLKCHKGSRSFEEKSAHQGDDAGLEKLYANEVSCLQKGCHDLAHEIDQLGNMEFWKPDESSIEALGLDMKRLDAVELPPPTQESVDDLFD